MDVDLCVGTVGMSVWFSKDLGENWKRASSSAGLNAECRVWTLAGSPATETPRYLYAGGDEGVHRWDETEQRWTHLRSPLDGRPVWAIAQSPHDARVVLAGCRPTALYRSDDAGDDVAPNHDTVRAVLRSGHLSPPDANPLRSLRQGHHLGCVEVDALTAAPMRRVVDAARQRHGINRHPRRGSGRRTAGFQGPRRSM